MTITSSDRMNDDYSWKPEYSVHIETIDRQHKALVGILRELQEAMWEGRGHAVQKSVLDRLAAYTHVHFRFEEEMLSEHGYALLAEHAEQHRLLTKQVEELQDRIQKGEAVSNASMMALLRSWLMGHIMVHDQKYARAFANVK